MDSTHERDTLGISDLKAALSPASYARGLRLDPYEWQEEVLDSPSKRILVCGARQSGKSTIVSVLPAHMAKYRRQSLSLVLAATQKQAVEDVEKIKAHAAADPGFPKIIRSADELIELETGSRIAVVAATEKGARGYSAPDVILIDEASRVEDDVYSSGVRPMLTHNPNCKLILISSPYGREGFFARAYRSHRWTRWLVRAPWAIVRDLGTPNLVEDRGGAWPEGVRGCYSPRHLDLSEQLEHLSEMGELMYRQEMLCEFLEPSLMAFSYDDIDRLFSGGGSGALEEGGVGVGSPRLEVGW